MASAVILGMAILAGTHAQDAALIEIVPIVPHSWSINSVALSADGTRVITAGREGQLRLWDAATGRLLRSLAGHSHEVTSVAFSPDGSLSLIHI